MPEGPKFTRFVRSVEGRAVARFGSGSASRACELIGAERRGTEIVWDTSKVTPLTEEYCTRYVRELNRAILRGDLVEVDLDAFLASVVALPRLELPELPKMPGLPTLHLSATAPLSGAESEPTK